MGILNVFPFLGGMVFQQISGYLFGRLGDTKTIGQPRYAYQVLFFSLAVAILVSIFASLALIKQLKVLARRKGRKASLSEELGMLEY
jgi:hypothetical protein